MVKGALRAHPKINLYLYSGEFDQMVPKENFTEQLTAFQGLPNLFYTNFPSSGHDGFYSEPQIFEELEKESKN